MAHIDSHTKARLVLLASILALLILGAVRPESSSLLRLAILVPGAFILAAILLLAVPYMAGERAEGHHLPGRRMVDFLEHNWILPLLGLIAVVAIAGISFMQLGSMTALEMVVFFMAAAAGVGSALWEWFKDLGPEAEEASPGHGH